jgi:hypothetical protein
MTFGLTEEVQRRERQAHISCRIHNNEAIERKNSGIPSLAIADGSREAVKMAFNPTA